MASTFFKRISERYGDENIKGGRYGRIVREILNENNTKTQNKIFRLTNESHKKSLKGFSKEKAKTIKLPISEDVISKRLSILKSAEHGKQITESLRDQLQRNLRDTMKEFSGTGENKMEIQRGRTTGKINPKLIKDFQDRIQETFVSRTKKDPETGVPGNVRNIAVTEIRSAIDDIKQTYTERLLEKNPNLEATKTWLQNKSLSRVPRKGHGRVNGTTIQKNEKFKVYREDLKNFDYMDRPHDPDAILEQKIGCSCDIIYKARIKQ